LALREICAPLKGDCRTMIVLCCPIPKSLHVYRPENSVWMITANSWVEGNDLDVTTFMV
jgi:hypothetical protein